METQPPSKFQSATWARSCSISCCPTKKRESTSRGAGCSPTDYRVKARPSYRLTKSHAFKQITPGRRRKFKRLRRKTKGARDWFDRLRRANPTLLAHWRLCHGNGRTSGAV